VELVERPNETLVVAFLPEWGGNRLVRLSNPAKRALLVPETLVLIESLPKPLQRFATSSSRWGDGVYARYMLKKTKGDGAETDALEIGSYSIPVEDFPGGTAVTLKQVPVYIQRVHVVLAGPDWKISPGKRRWWLSHNRRHPH